MIQQILFFFAVLQDNRTTYRNYVRLLSNLNRRLAACLGCALKTSQLGQTLLLFLISLSLFCKIKVVCRLCLKRSLRLQVCTTFGEK